MHWVKATTPDGRVQYVNLAAIPTILPAPEGAVVFLGGVGAKVDGTALYATTTTKETPEQLLALPVVTAPVAAAVAASKGPVVVEATRKKARA